ncbi:MAG TPA: hypothetical protein VIS52_03435 [Motiliproteus sp.]
MSACHDVLQAPVDPALTLLVERFGQDGWLVRRSAETPQRWIVLCHNSDESGRRLAGALIDSAGDENWWVVAIATPATTYGGGFAGLKYVADELEQGRLACLNGNSVPHFYLFGCDEGACAAESFACACPERVIRLVLLPGQAFNRRLKSQHREECEAEGRRLVRTPLLVVLSGQLVGDGSGAASESRHTDRLLAIDGWLRQIRRSAYRRGIQPDCGVLALPRSATMRTTQLLLEPQLFAEVGAFYRGHRALPLASVPAATTGPSTLKFML